MSAVTFSEPATVEEACSLLAADPWASKAISGGTAVVLMMRNGLIAPESLVSLGGITALRGIATVDGRLRVGAGTTLTEVATSPEIRKHAPSLAHACAVVGNPRVRNVATLGGNLAEADYASDPPATLASLGAACSLVGTGGARQVRVIDFITGFYETVLEHDEIVTHIDIPLATTQRGAVYLKYRSRSSEDRACVGVAARADFVDGVVSELEVVVGAVASTPQRVPGALEQAIGSSLEADVRTSIGRAYAEAIEPMDDARGSAWYRRKMIDVFVRRALEQVLESRQSGGVARG